LTGAVTHVDRSAMPAPAQPPYGDLEDRLDVLCPQLTRLASGRRPGALRQGPDLGDIVTWRALTDLLNSSLHDDRVDRLTRGEQTIPASSYTQRLPDAPGGPRGIVYDPVRLQELFRGGATLEVAGLHRRLPTVGRVCRRFERWFRSWVIGSAFLAHGARSRTPTHCDRQDGFFLQLAGSKRWRVFEPMRRDSLPGDLDLRYHSPPAWEGDLAPGDALFVPRGWFHQPELAAGVTSLHLTVSVGPVTAVDLMAWLVEDLRESDVMRAELPRFEDEHRQRQHAEAVWHELERRWHPDIIEEHLAAADAADRPGRGSFPWSFDGDVTPDSGVIIESGTSRRIDVTDAGGALIVEAIGRQWRVDARLRPLLEWILAGHRVPAEHLALYATGGLSVDELSAMVTDLVRDGLLVVVEP